MYIISNAARNLFRNKGRNILMAIILLAILVTSGISIIINTTTDKIINDYKNRFGVQISISPDLKKLQALANAGKSVNLPSITANQYQAFAQSKYVQEAQLKFDMGVSSDTLKGIDQDKGNNNQGAPTAPTGGISVGNGGLQAVTLPTLHVIGYNSVTMLSDFTQGLRKIISGRIYQKQNECIVSQDFAKLNHLKVGDTIKLKGSDNSKQVYNLVISGIYSDLTPEYSNGIQLAYTNRRNEILTSFATVAHMTNTNQAAVTATYILKSPDDLPLFTAEIRALGLSNDYDVSGDTASYNRIVGPVEGLSSIATTFLIVVLILGAIILILLTLMSVRERKYEIGVLRAMGMKKARVASGLLVEMLLITALCVAIGTTISTVVAQPVSDILLAQQVQIANQQQQQTSGTLGTVSITPIGQQSAPPIAKITVSLDLTSFEEITGVAVLLVLLSSTISIIYITKYEPMKILVERN